MSRNFLTEPSYGFNAEGALSVLDDLVSDLGGITPENSGLSEESTSELVRLREDLIKLANHYWGGSRGSWEDQVRQAGYDLGYKLALVARGDQS